MALPLDSDGFLRRECPTCDRELKWLVSEEGAAERVPDGGYFCPYCGIQAEPSSWLTQAQASLAENVMARELFAPEMEKLARSLGDLGRSSGGLIEASVQYEVPDEEDPLTEADDMRRVDFACHPTEPVKVLEDWEKPVFCLICGKPQG